MTSDTIRVLRDKDSNRYCVPAALSALTGLAVDTIIPLLAEELGDQPITGIFLPIAIKVLKGLSYEVKPYSWCDLTVNQFGQATHKTATKYLISIRGHALVIHRGMVYDSQFEDGIIYGRYPCKGYRIEMAFEIGPLGHGRSL